MGRAHGSQRLRLFLPLVALLSSGTVLFSAGDVVRISLPAHSREVSGTIEVRAEVTASAPVAYVLLVVDGTRPASTNSLPATFQLDTRELSNGPHVLSAEAYADFQMIAVVCWLKLGPVISRLAIVEARKLSSEWSFTSCAGLGLRGQPART